MPAAPDPLARAPTPADAEALAALMLEGSHTDVRPIEHAAKPAPWVALLCLDVRCTKRRQRSSVISSVALS